MNFLTLSTPSSWPKGEETFRVEPSVMTGPPLPVLILMGLVLLAMLVVWWKSKRDKK